MNKSIIKKIISIILFPISIFYMELLLHVGSNMELLLLNVPGCFLVSASLGIFLYLLAGLAGKIFGFVLLEAITVLFTITFYTNEAYQVFMDPATLLAGAADVVGGFSDRIVTIMVFGFPMIFLFHIPVIVYLFLFLKFKIYPLISLKTAVCASLLFILLSVTAHFVLGGISDVHHDKYNSEFEYDSAVRVFGVVPAVVRETFLVYLSNDKRENSNLNSLDALNEFVESMDKNEPNEYTGLFKGKNLIFITAEAFSKEVIDEKRTPTLYRMATKGMIFEDYYQPSWGGSTTTGEYSLLTGLVPTNGVRSIKDTVGKSMSLSIGNQLKNLGYTAKAYHNGIYTYYDRNITHPNFGYDEFTGRGNGMEEKIVNGWPASDLEMLEYSLPKYIDKAPFSIYYMTVSGHCVYSAKSNEMCDKNEEAVKKLLEGQDYSDTVTAYLACNMELEKAMEYLINSLEEKGILDDTVIVIAADHYPYGLEKSVTWNNKKDFVNELYGFEVKNRFERDHNALIIYSGCLEKMKPVVISDPTYSLDILPTLSNLFDIQYDSRLLVGRDVFSSEEALVIWRDYSFKTRYGYYDSLEGRFHPDERTISMLEESQDEYVQRLREIVRNKIDFSKKVIQLDYYRRLQQ